MVRLRIRSLIRMYRIDYFTESVLASSRTKDPEPISLNRTGPPRGFGDLGRMAIYFHGAREHW